MNVGWMNVGLMNGRCMYGRCMNGRCMYGRCMYGRCMQRPYGTGTGTGTGYRYKTNKPMEKRMDGGHFPKTKYHIIHHPYLTILPIGGKINNQNNSWRMGSTIHHRVRNPHDAF